LVQMTDSPRLPKDGTIGDLLLIQNTVVSAGLPVSDSCSLWLCVPAPTSIRAHWREIKLGNVVRGTI
jgi:hypothetical protein